MPEHSEKSIDELTIEDVSSVTPLDINRYLTLLQGNASNGLKLTTVKRRRATLSSMYSFYVSNGKMDKNPVLATKTIRIPEKTLVYLNNDEQRLLLNTVRSGSNLSSHASKFHNRYAERDSALFLLLLDTGLRVSEMLSTDIVDYDLEACSVVVVRKGGDIQVVYYSDECAEYLSAYFNSQTVKYAIKDGKLPAFTTLKGERLGVRAVEKLVKKYVEACLPDKAKLISPHKLRSSFAMSFYEASDNNILLLQKKLHHKSISTTNIYAKASDREMEETRSILQGRR
jgi:site-specific recombinase XerD